MAGWGWGASWTCGQESWSSASAHPGLHGRAYGCIWFLLWPLFCWNICPRVYPSIPTAGTGLTWGWRRALASRTGNQWPPAHVSQLGSVPH